MQFSKVVKMGKFFSPSLFFESNIGLKADLFGKISARDIDVGVEFNLGL